MAAITKLKPEFELAKRLKGPSQMERVRAARAIINGRGGNSEAFALQGFMAIFHPDFDADRTRQMVNDVRERERRRR